jgi:DNA-binding SARP family transcriptional activator/tetratricopeptide (TPR) repeat protein/GTPase SAR1 family protein
MRFVILGQTALHAGAERIPLGAAKQRGLLALLLLHAGEPVRVDTIVELLWGDHWTERHRTALYALVSRTRAALSAAHLPNALLRVDAPAAYRLVLDPELVDYHWFRSRVRAAQRAADDHRYDVAVTLLTEAVEVWGDEPLADLRGAAAEALRAELNGAFLDAVKLLAAGQLKLGRHYAVLARLEPLVRAHDLDETLARHWISALCAAGRHDQAHAFHADFRRRFRREMRTEPSVEPPARPGIPATAPQLKSTAADRSPPRQIPHDINDFIGRAELIARLTELAGRTEASTSIIVVSGMPGAGKTTLVNHWAHEHRERFPDGQAYVDANAFGPAEPADPHDMLGGLLRAFHVAPEHLPADTRIRQEYLNRILAGKRVLILIDNARDSEQVRPLLPNSDACTVVITSRNRLKGLSIREGARNVTVDPLSHAESVELLSRIIGAQRAGAEPEAISALARTVAGLPLALCIIGEHVAERPRARIAELAEELLSHLLDAEMTDDVDADVSLHQVFAWSYRALQGEHARLFRILGRFPGMTFGAGAAAAMAGRSVAPTEHVLNVLAKSHLINHDAVRRYGFHDLLRRYAADQALREETAEERTAAMWRLTTWYLCTAANAAKALAPHRPAVPDLPAPTGIEVAEFDSDTAAMRWSQAERANLLAVARAAMAHGLFRHVWQLAGAMHDALSRYGRQDDAFELHQLALTAARSDGHPIGEIGTMANLGSIFLATHDYARAAATLEAGVALARRIGHLDGEMICLHNLASVHLASGDFTAAVALYRRAVGVFHDLGNLVGEAAALHRLGVAHRALGEPEAARRYYARSLAIRERVGIQRGQGMVHSDLADLHLANGDFDLALRHCALALALHARAGDEGARCDTLLIAADTKRMLGGVAEATEDAHQALAIAEDMADPLRRAHGLAVLGDCLVRAAVKPADKQHTAEQEADRERARRTCAEALRMLEGLTDPTASALRARLEATRQSIDPDTDSVR